MYVFNDGGREAAGFKPSGDCGVRAIAVATGMDYAEVRKMMRKVCKQGKAGTGSLSNGIYKEDLNTALEAMGWYWCAAPKFQGRKARYSDIPGKAIVRMAKHYAAVVDGALHDTWDSSDKMVYGYWAKKEEK